MKQLHVHEVESYDLEKGICDLKGLELICNKCHSFHHIGRMYGVLNSVQTEDLISHFTKVNKIEKEDYYEYLRLLKLKWRNNVQEKFDKMMSNKEKYFAPEKVKFKISCDIPYKDEVISQLKKKNLYIED